MYMNLIPTDREKILKDYISYVKSSKRIKNKNGLTAVVKYLKSHK
jgi:hypothetical protein